MVWQCLICNYFSIQCIEKIIYDFAFQVIAYKYKYGGPDEALVGEKVVGLIRILIHTIAAQTHVCDRHSRPVPGGMTMR